MRTQKLGETIFHHQLTFEGNVEIIVKPNKVGHVPATYDVNEHYVVMIPFDDIKRLVLDGLRHKMIQQLTNASDGEIEQWLLGKL